MAQTHPHRMLHGTSTGAPRAFRIIRDQSKPVDYEQDLRDAGLVEGPDGIWHVPIGCGV